MPTRSLCYLFVHPCIHPSPGLPQEHGLNVALGARKQRFESRGLLFCILGARWHTGVSFCGDIQNEGFERDNKYLSVSRWKKITSNGGNTGVCGRKIGGWGQIIRLLFGRCCFLTLRCPCSCLGDCFWLPRMSSITWPSLRAKSSSRAQWILIKDGNGFPPSF